MIITAKEYPALWKSITQFSYSNNTLEGYCITFKYLIDSFCGNGNLNAEVLKNIVQNELWTQLPEIDLSKNYKVNLFHNLSTFNISILQKNFRDIGIDLILELQKANKALLLNPKNVSEKELNNYNQKFYNSSQFFINLVVNNDYPIISVEQHDIFKTLLNRLVKTYQKNTHKDTLQLIYKAIKLQYSEDDVLTWIKDFITTNPDISVNVTKIFSTLKKEIKDYDLNKYFSEAEIKDLYENENTGIYIKKVENMICELDLNVIASNHKQASILEINKNLRVLEQNIVQQFKSQPDFSGSTPTITDPKIIFRFMFEKGTLYKYESILENLIAEVASYPKLVSQSHIESLVTSTFLASKLEKQLPNKPLSANKKKI